MTLSEARAQASAGYVQKTVQAQQDSEQKVASVPRDESASSSETTTQSATAQSPPAPAPLSEIASSENAESKHVHTSHVQTSPRKTGRRSTPNVSVNTRVTLDSDLVDAPSIGPKTAARFAKIGIHSIRQFVEADPAEMHRGLDTRWITEQLIGEWQDQAKLVCEVPVLCGYKAQLLVAAGCRTSRDLARSVPADLYQRVAHVARGIDGQRILRSAKPPASQDISSWITAALESKSSKAA